MMAKYWSAFFLLALIVAALSDRERNVYFRSAAPYVTVAAAALVFMPHIVWLFQTISRLCAGSANAAPR